MYVFRGRTQPRAVARSDCSDCCLNFTNSARFFTLWLRSFQCRCHCASKRQRHGDDDYSKGDELDQIIWPFSVGVSITEETRSANAQRVGSFHVYCIPFTNEMTILMQQYGQLFGSTRWIAKVTPPSPCQTHENASAALF